jgi:hypothetical protein
MADLISQLRSFNITQLSNDRQQPIWKVRVQAAAEAMGCWPFMDPQTSAEDLAKVTEDKKKIASSSSSTQWAISTSRPSRT